MSQNFDMLAALTSLANNMNQNNVPQQGQQNALQQQQPASAEQNDSQDASAVGSKTANSQVLEDLLAQVLVQSLVQNSSQNSLAQAVKKNEASANKDIDSIIAERLAKYDQEKFLKNSEFKNLYQAAYEALGDDLDTESFVSLLDKYVDSRISAFNKVNSMNKENEMLTDKMQFQSGQSKKNEKKLRMQDIPPEQLEEYIAKYI